MGLELILRTSALLAAAAMLSRLLVRAAPATRHLVWHLTIGLVVVAPILLPIMPEIGIKVPNVPKVPMVPMVRTVLGVQSALLPRVPVPMVPTLLAAGICSRESYYASPTPWAASRPLCQAVLSPAGLRLRGRSPMSG